MFTTERHVLKSLKRVADELPDSLSKDDSRFIIKATNATITALIAADEPINKTHQYIERAKHIAEDLQTFIRHRSGEQWSAESTYINRYYGIVKELHSHG